MKVLANIVLPTALLALAVSCGSSSETSSTEIAFHTAALEETPSRPFIDRMVDAEETTAYRVQRVVEMRYELPGGIVSDLRYRELLYSDGNGQFAIEQLGVEEPAMSSQDEDWFLLLQGTRDTFFRNYRDFRLRDLEILRQNYELTFLDLKVNIAGRRCVQLDVRRKTGASTYYVVAVDPESALVLRAEEFLTNGQSIATMEVESLALAPDLTGVEFKTNNYESTVVNAQDPSNDIDQPVLEPGFLPSGYQLVELSVMQVGLISWVKQVYSDGVEQFAFLHHPVSGTTPSGVAIPLPGQTTGSVRTFTVGPWNGVQGQVSSHQVILMGKTDLDSLLLTLQSAVE